ncbi:hypothetical protein MJ561_14865 [Klebsiella pneumoniae]|nr:hypothetical protein MJ561_14865 [Klebsiella pneumoniae]
MTVNTHNVETLLTAAGPDCLNSATTGINEIYALLPFSSLMCMDMMKLTEQLRFLNSKADRLHVDIMDGHY